MEPAAPVSCATADSLTRVPVRWLFLARDGDARGGIVGGAAGRRPALHGVLTLTRPYPAGVFHRELNAESDRERLDLCAGYESDRFHWTVRVERPKHLFNSSENFNRQVLGDKVELAQLGQPTPP